MNHMRIMLLYVIFGWLFAGCNKNEKADLEQLQVHFIHIWNLVDMSNYDDLHNAVKEAKNVWSIIKRNTQTNKTQENQERMASHLDKLEIFLTDMQLDSMAIYAQRGALLTTELFPNVELEPVHKLLRMQLDYNEISYAIHDPMFGLLEWSDFTNLMNSFQASWYEYLGLTSEEDVLLRYTHLTKQTHNEQKELLDQCLNELLDSMESANQENFKLPCDDLGNALKNLIFLYAGGQQSHYE